MTNMRFPLLAPVVCISFFACGGKAVDMGGAWDAGTESSVAGEGGAQGIDAAADDADAAADAAEGMPPGCNLPWAQNDPSQIRVGNLVTSEQVFDFCFQKPGSTGFGTALFASSGSHCPKGLAYRQVSVPFRVPEGNTRVKVIAYGASCDGPSLVTGDLQLKTAQAKSVLVVGDGNSAPSLLIGAESRGTNPSSFLIRFVHAAPHMTDLDFGLVKGADPPGYLYLTFGRDYPFGSAIPGVPLSLMDGNGYVEPQVPGGLYPVGVAPYDSSQEWNIQATYAASLKFLTGSSYTVFMIGRGAQDPIYPYQLWACREHPVSPGVFATCSDNPMF